MQLFCLSMSLLFAVGFNGRTRHEPEDKKEERPREGRSLVNTGRDDWIQTSAPPALYSLVVRSRSSDQADAARASVRVSIIADCA